MAVVDQFSLGPIGTNCYVVRSDRGATEAVVVDPSGTAAEIRIELARMGATCTAILVTHGHFDHTLGVAELAEATGAPVHMAKAERSLLETPGDYSSFGVTLRAWSPEVLLDGDETLTLAGISFDVLRVPGHSPAHLAYACDAGLLSGDVLFQGSVGRTDLPGASWDVLLASISSLYDRFPDETVIFPGHGPITTLGAELHANPFLGDLRAARDAAGEEQ